MGSVAGDDVVGNDGGGAKERIFVSVRIRPLNEKEIEKNDASDWECINNNTLIFRDSLPERSIYPSAYTFDRVFGRDNSTKQVYEEGVKEVALSVVSGINSSIFAYGQTSSGKTYTMTGVTQYSMSEIYEYIHEHPERDFSLKFSAIEIYNELVKDLLNPDSGPLRLLDDPEKGTTVEKLTEEILRDEEHLKELLSFCEAQRQIGETSLNEMSSRSHQILRLTIESSAREFVGKNTFSTLVATVNFVDLAGSERASQALTAGSRLKEGCHINRSLLTLGTVIRKLSKGRTGHIPYRDSKLTRILQSTLGGNARTAIICTMSPARCHIEQSRNTLQFAICAKEVATSAQVNVIMSDKALVKHLQKEVARLENEMKYTGLNSLASTSDALKEKDAQIKKMENEMKELMKQRDLAQSRLEDLLRTVAYDQASGPWEESSQSSMPCTQLSFDDTSLSDSSVVSYHSPEYGVSHVHSNSKLCGKVEDQQHTITPLCHSSKTLDFTYQDEEISPSTSPDIDIHFKEVQCIRMIKPSMIKVDEFMPLSNENIHSPVAENEEPVEVQIVNKQNFEVETEVNNELICRIETESINVPLQWNVVNKLSKSKSCRASFMNCGSSLWFEEIENCKDTSCNSVFKDNPELPRISQKNISVSSGYEKKEHKIDTSANSEVSVLNDVTKFQDDEISYNGKFSHSCDSVNGLKEIARLQYQQGLSDDQDPKNDTSNDNSTVKTMANQINDICLKPVLKPSESQSEWKMEFRKKQQGIVELWHACNVSLIHRSYFFLLIKGDLADSIYVEVEHRRLSFLKKSCSQGYVNKTIALENVSLDLSEKIVRREREKLCRAMNRMQMSKREALYKKWGVDLNSKQRRMQVARKVWTETKDMDHVKESAILVAKLFGFLEPRLAPKEMFGLSFMPRSSTHASYSSNTRR